MEDSKHFALVIGNRSKPLRGKSYEWTFYVEIPKGPKDWITSVTVELHPTFTPPTVTLTKPPFELTRKGYGTFDITGTVHFADGSKFPFVHHLSFDPHTKKKYRLTASSPPTSPPSRGGMPSPSILNHSAPPSRFPPVPQVYPAPPSPFGWPHDLGASLVMAPSADYGMFGGQPPTGDWEKQIQDLQMQRERLQADLLAAISREKEKDDMIKRLKEGGAASGVSLPGGDIINLSHLEKLSITELKDLEKKTKESCDFIHQVLVEKMEKELSKARDASECSICMDAPIDTIFMPCMHMIVCNSCAQTILGKQGECPNCRAKIEKLAKVFAK